MKLIQKNLWLTVANWKDAPEIIPKGQYFRGGSGHWVYYPFRNPKICTAPRLFCYQIDMGKFKFSIKLLLIWYPVLILYTVGYNNLSVKILKLQYFSKSNGAISRTNDPILGLSELIWMHFSYLNQVWLYLNFKFFWKNNFFACRLHSTSAWWRLTIVIHSLSIVFRLPIQYDDPTSCGYNVLNKNRSA